MSNHPVSASAAREWLQNRLMERAAKCISEGKHNSPELRAYDVPELLDAFSTEQTRQLREELAEAKGAIGKWRERVHAKFGFKQDPNTTERKCACAYCRGDVEALSDHAADMEMSIWCKGGLAQRAQAAEAERDKLLNAVYKLREALALTRSMILSGEKMSKSAEARIEAAFETSELERLRKEAK